TRRRRSIPPTPIDEITADMPPSEPAPSSRPEPPSPAPPSSGKNITLPGLPAPSSSPPGDSKPPRRESPVSVAIVTAPRSADDAPLPRSGTFVLPASAAQMLALAITRPLLESDLEPIALPVLFRRLLARRSVMGTVFFEASGFELAFDVESGSAALTRAEHSSAQRLWDLRQGKWRLSDERQSTMRRDLYPLNRLALDGLKRMLRSLDAADLEKAFGELLDLSPQIRSDRQTLPKRLGLGGRELRFIDQMLSGKLTGRAALAEGTLGPTNTLQLYALLELHDALMWTEVGSREPSPRSLRGRRTLMGMSVGSRPLRTTLPFEKSSDDGDDSDR
ncbi:MAG TPA: hypothetical protein VFB62_06270, partial [Polyangiaceae bacterium]|nr:hypothetical protein [Polyangiaceae bacterium]